MCFQNTSYRSSDYDAPSGEFRLPVHHLWFLEWIGVPQSACLLEMGAGRWVDHLSRDQAIAAAVHLQRDVGLMQTNLDVLDQYTLSLQGMASKLVELCLGAREFPAEEVAAGALGPRVRRASVQMEAMGLWRPSLDPLRLHLWTVVSWTCFILDLYYICIIFEFLLLVSFFLVASLHGVLPVK